MKHKKDAIEKADEIIARHVECGLKSEQAIKAALVTIKCSQLREESLRRRVENRLTEMIYGEELAVQIHSKQQLLKSARMKLLYDPHNAILKKSIESLKLDLQNLTGVKLLYP